MPCRRTKVSDWLHESGDNYLDAHRSNRVSSGSDARRVRELERELRRKEKALAEAAALLVLSKKLEAIFHKDADA